jgi:hypothetical protein
MSTDVHPSIQGQLLSRLGYAFLLVGTISMEFATSGRTLAYPWTSFLFIPITLIKDLEFIDGMTKAVIGLFAGAALWIFALALGSHTIVLWIARIAAPRRATAVMGISAGIIIVLFALCTVAGAYMELLVMYPRNPHHNYSWVYLIWPCFLLFGVLFLLWYDRANVA